MTNQPSFFEYLDRAACDEPYTDEDWRLATERVRAIRERVLADPRIAELEDRKYAEITRRLQKLKAVRRKRRTARVIDVGSA